METKCAPRRSACSRPSVSIVHKICAALEYAFLYTQNFQSCRNKTHTICTGKPDILGKRAKWAAWLATGETFVEFVESNGEIRGEACVNHGSCGKTKMFHFFPNHGEKHGEIVLFLPDFHVFPTRRFVVCDGCCMRHHWLMANAIGYGGWRETLACFSLSLSPRSNQYFRIQCDDR